MQQITHQLRTKGYGTDFPEITAVMPWIDFAWEINQNLQDDQVAEPRLFKSHARLSAIQEGCKYIVTIRDPIKTLISLFRFFTAKFPDPPFPKQWLENVSKPFDSLLCIDCFVSLSECAQIRSIISPVAPCGRSTQFGVAITGIIWQNSGFVVMRKMYFLSLLRCSRKIWRKKYLELQILWVKKYRWIKKRCRELLIFLH